jgi:MATE family multidrug resistance protein
VFIKGNGSASAIISQAATLLLVLAAMQVFEYVGTVANGVLRGLKDTRVPMLISVASFWGVATGVGIVLGFGLQQQALGIWIGLGCGAIAFSALTIARVRQHGFRFGTNAAPARSSSPAVLTAKA